MAIVKSLPKSAWYQETLADGSKLYVSHRTAYIVNLTPVGEVINSIHINKKQ